MLIRLVWPHLATSRLPAAQLAVLQLVQAAAALLLPALHAEIIDRGVVKGDLDYIMRHGAVMLAVSVLQVICAVGATYLGVRIATLIGARLRASVFAHIQTFSLREVGQFTVSSLTTRTTNDVHQVEVLVLVALTILVSAPIIWVGAITLAVLQDVPLSLLLAAIVPVLGVLTTMIVRRLYPLFRSMQVHVDLANRVLREQILGVRVIRAYVRDEYEQRRFGLANDGLTDVSLRAGRLTAMMSPLLIVVVNVFSAPLIWFGAYRIDNGAIQIGALTAFLGYLLLVLTAVTQVASALLLVPRAKVCAERIGEVLQTESSVVPPPNPVLLPHSGRRLEWRGASFRYPGAEAPVLHGVDLRTWPGETTAVVGSTGSGKTTLLGLAVRLFDVTDGQVLVDGEDVRDLEPAALARAVGLVPQKSHLLAGTVASNLRCGRPEATDDELWRALELAQVREFVQQLDGGLAAPIAPLGANVSGGQRQRLAIARVIVQQPRIYLFDDSFSALDYATEGALRAALVPATADATVVVVAQRVNTIRDAERIIVLDDGQVVGTGTHRHLMSDNATYREIVLSQLTEDEAGSIASDTNGPIHQ